MSGLDDRQSLLRPVSALNTTRQPLSSFDGPFDGAGGESEFTDVAFFGIQGFDHFLGTFLQTTTSVSDLDPEVLGSFANGLQSSADGINDFLADFFQGFHGQLSVSLAVFQRNERFGGHLDRGGYTQTLQLSSDSGVSEAGFTSSQTAVSHRGFHGSVDAFQSFNNFFGGFDLIDSFFGFFSSFFDLVNTFLNRIGFNVRRFDDFFDRSIFDRAFATSNYFSVFHCQASVSQSLFKKIRHDFVSLVINARRRYAP